MALRLQALVQGEVRIRVMGDRAAFLSAAAERGLPLYDIAYLGEDIAVTLALKDVRRLKAVCHAAHCRFRPLRRRGWPFLMRHIVRRSLLIIGALLFCCALTLLSGIVMSVQLAMPRPLTPEQQLQVLQIAEEQGIRAGQPLWSMDAEAAEYAILTQTDFLTFVEIEKRPQLVITAVARREADAGPNGLLPGDVVAERSGVIEEILVLKGTAAVQPGDVVAAGDVLIRGIGGGELVAAQGLISAACWYESYAEWPLLAIEHLPRGKARAGLYLQDKNGSRLLLGAPAPAQLYSLSSRSLPFAAGRKSGSPVELIYQVYTKADTVLRSYTETEAVELAALAAEEAALAQLPADAAIISRSYRRLDEAESIIRLHLQLQTRQNIGVYRQLDTATAEAYRQELLLPPG